MYLILFYLAFMPSRKDIFRNGSIYHIFNKTIDRRLIFEDDRISDLFLKLLRYYRSTKSIIRYSHFNELKGEFRVNFEKQILIPEYFKIEILTFCLMPNHFHLLLKQKKEDGIIRFMSDTVNSVTRFFNILHERKGPVFLPQFRSRQIHTRELLIHVSRYQHLNPFSSGIVKNINDLLTYPLSSFNEYSNTKFTSLCNTDIILKEFNYGKTKYQEFVISNAEHQKMLESVKYIEKWM